MEWHITDAQSLAAIDQQIGSYTVSASKYEIIRQVIYATADFEYQSLLSFSDQALQSGAAALAARSTIVVDVPMVQVAIMPIIQATFANPVYCSTEVLMRPQQSVAQGRQTKAAWGIETLARRYPEGIFVVGQSQTALLALSELLDSGIIQPALVVSTPAWFIDKIKNTSNSKRMDKSLLDNALVPNIQTVSDKGGAGVAAAIMRGLTDLAWQAYGQGLYV